MSAGGLDMKNSNLVSGGILVVIIGIVVMMFGFFSFSIGSIQDMDWEDEAVSAAINNTTGTGLSVYNTYGMLAMIGAIFFIVIGAGLIISSRKNVVSATIVHALGIILIVMGVVFFFFFDGMNLMSILLLIAGLILITFRQKEIAICPQCEKEYPFIKNPNGKTDITCPYCGVKGYVE